MLIEAFACGVPVLASNSGEIPHVGNELNFAFKRLWYYVGGLEGFMIEKSSGSTKTFGGVDDFWKLPQKDDLIILDLALPKLDGQEVLRRLRARNNRTPVMVMTANNAISSRVSELDHGADDYVAKPFDVEELEARVAPRPQLTRTGSPSGSRRRLSRRS